MGGTLIGAWASMKSLQRKEKKRRPSDDDPGNPSEDFHGEKRTNETHESTADPEARLARKGRGKESKLAYCGSALMDNRHCLCVEFRVDLATGTAERGAEDDRPPAKETDTPEDAWCRQG